MPRQQRLSRVWEKLRSCRVLGEPGRRTLEPPAPIEPAEELEDTVSRLPLGATSNRRTSNQKGKTNKAINILAVARRASSAKVATKALEDGFASVTSVKSKNAIRKEVVSVLKEAKGSDFLPPTPDKLKFLGGVLKAAGYKSADNYLGEYKLMGVESGHQWSDQLG